MPLQSNTLTTMSCFRSTFHVGVRLQPATRLYFVRSFSSVHDVVPNPISAPPPPAASIKSGNALSNALQATAPRNNWTKGEISDIYNTPLIELQYAAVCSTILPCQSTNKLHQFLRNTWDFTIEHKTDSCYRPQSTDAFTLPPRSNYAPS